MNKLYLDKTYKDDCIGKPITPSNWVGEAEYIPVTRIRMTCGGGMGGSSWFEFVEAVDEIQPGKMLKVRRAVDRKEIVINTNYVVTAEDFDIAHMKLDSQNNNFEVGIYDVYILAEKGHRFAFTEKFMQL